MHRQVTAVAEREGWPVPSYSSVYAIIRGIDPAMAMLAHEGSKRYKEVFDLVHRREAAKPNEIWQADHTLLDLWVLTPSGRPGRPWLTLIEDDHSRAIAGYAVNLGAPPALTTALAFRQAIWRKPWPGWHVCGIPGAFHVDHGSDFTSAHMEQVMADLKIRAYFSLPGQPPLTGQSLDHPPVVPPQVNRELDRRCASCRPACRLDGGGPDPATGVPWLIRNRCGCREAGNAGGSLVIGVM